ncbi:NAD(P)/FAD-dependent oxidoreductase [Thalassospira alkalitolerans]|uniref:NAD(P)/FAD-dependent oxidoreductase n=1 Tax=Thalassospira alkalitolerans TaxID=1293890 RepID=UPI003AA83798
MMSKRIAIVGGGYIGAELAKSLEETGDVILIEPRSHFVHAPAMIRAVVEPALLDQALIPYDGLLKRGKIIQACAESIDSTGVTLEGGEKISADYVVVATGSSNATPFKPTEKGIEGLRADNARIHAMLRAANNVVIVGAGAVGTELAGEIAHFMPEKKLTLISDQPSLFPDMPPKLGRGLEAKLRAAGVTLVLGARAENLENFVTPYAGTLKLSNGAEIGADLIFPAIGSRAASKLLENLPGVVKSSSNRIKTDEWMRPSRSLPNVFAAGDVADAGDAMTIVAASRQLPWLKKTLMSLVAGKKLEEQKPYKPWAEGKAPILIPLGPSKGSSFLVLFIAGNLLTRMMKGKDLFISKYRKLFGQS